MRTITNRGGNFDLRDILLKAGVGSWVTPMAIQYMNFLPTTTDPYAQGVIEIVKGLQRLLIQRGARISVDGGLGEKTVHELMRYAGPRWYDKSWSQLYGDVIDGRAWESWDREGRASHDVAALSGLGATRFRLDQVAGMGHTAYHHVGLGAADPGSMGAPYYCSPGNPQGGCTPLSNVAKPMNAVTLQVFQRLQRAVNAFLAQMGKSLIDVDGRIGPGTVSALRDVMEQPGFTVARSKFGGQFDFENVAANSVVIVSDLESLVTAMGVAYVADPAPTSPPSLPGPGGSVINPSDSAIAASMGLQRLLPYAAVGVGVLLVLELTKKRKKRGRR